MKNANNNEMDLALHALAKSERGESSLPANSSGSNGKDGIAKHLDADELNSYAEGLVPDLARTRYTEHLADCSSCRKIVIGLTQALGPAPSTLIADPEPGHSFWKKLSAFLAFPVLRFGVPALALTAIISIGFLAWRRDSQTDFLAQRQPDAAAKAPTTQDSNSSVQDAPLTSPRSGDLPAPKPSSAATTDSLGKPEAERPQSRMEPTPADESRLNFFLKDSAVPPPPPAAPSAASKPSNVDTVLSEPSKVGALASDRAPGEVQKYADKKQDQANASVAQTRAGDETNFEKQQEREDDNRAFSESAPSGPRRAERLSGVRGGYGRKNKRDTTDDDESRSVAGRSFRRQGSSWVDTAYASSQMTINVKRGSEQFRALVADEPGIRDIANSLAGEIILVWKGKAYRIR